MKAVRAELLVPGHVHRAEWTLKRKDGIFVPVEVSAHILPDGRWQAFVRDISERKRAEEALRPDCGTAQTLHTAAIGLTHCSRDVALSRGEPHAYARRIRPAALEQIVGRTVAR